MFGYLTAPFYRCPLSVISLVQTHTLSASVRCKAILLVRISSILSGELTALDVLCFHLARHPLRPPILTFGVPVAFLFWEVGVGVFAFEFLVISAIVLLVAVAASPAPPPVAA